MKKYSPIIVLFLATLVAHGLMLLNHGHFYDGSIAYNLQKYHDIFALKQGNLSVGYPITYYVHRIIWALHGETFIHGLISFFTIFLSSVFIFKIAKSLKIYSSQFILVLCIFVITYPSVTFSFNRAITPFMIYFLLFFIAFYLGNKSEKQHLASKFILSIISLSLFFISFTLPSLLMFYLTFIIVLYYTYNQDKISFAPNRIISFILKRIHFILLPMVFWMIKSIFFKPKGFYLNYNKLHLYDLKTYVMMYKNFFYATFRPTLLWAILFLTTLISMLYIIYRKRTLLHEIRQKRKYVFALLFGLLAWFAAVTPYVCAGKIPLISIFPEALYRSRYLILTSPAMALIFTSLLFCFFSRNGVLLKAGKCIAFVFALYFILFWWFSYLNWQSSKAFRESIVQQLKTHQEWKHYSVYIVRNDFFYGYFNPFYSYEWGIILNDAYGGNSRVGTSANICAIKKLYAIPHLPRLFGIRNMNLNGEKAFLKVIPTNKTTFYFYSFKLKNHFLIIPAYFAIGLKYLYYNYLNHKKLNTYLQKLVTISVTSNKKHYNCGSMKKGTREPYKFD